MKKPVQVLNKKKSSSGYQLTIARNNPNLSVLDFEFFKRCNTNLKMLSTMYKMFSTHAQWT